MESIIASAVNDSAKDEDESWKVKSQYSSLLKSLRVGFLGVEGFQSIQSETNDEPEEKRHHRKGWPRRCTTIPGFH